VANILGVICHESMHYGMRSSIASAGFRYLTPRTIIKEKKDFEGEYLCQELLWGNFRKQYWEYAGIIMNEESWNKEKYPLFSQEELNKMSTAHFNVRISGMCSYESIPYQ
jgi:hypothetical protein